MNRAARKISIHGEQIERAGMNILWWNVVSEVNDLSGRISGKDHALHRPNEIILRPEVGKKRDDGMPIRHQLCVSEPGAVATGSDIQPRPFDELVVTPSSEEAHLFRLR